MNYSRRQLEAFGEPLGESATRLKPFGRIYGTGGGGGPTSSTVTQTTIPEYLRPQVEGLLGGSMQELFNFDKSKKDAEGNPIYDLESTKAFVPYSYSSKDYLAGFQPLQVQAQANAANLGVPLQYARGSDFANTAGVGGMDSANQAGRFGQSGFQSGQIGQNIGGLGGQFFGGMGANYGAQAAGMAGEAQGFGRNAADIGGMGLRAEQYGRQISGQAEDLSRQAAGAQDRFNRQVTDPSAVQQFMSPYQQAVTDNQLSAARRQADISRSQRGASAARAGAFGGARQAIENAEAEKNLQSQLSSIQATGQQSAYDKAMQNIQFGSSLGLQGLGGAQSGLGTALQGGQLGLSGIGTALQGQQAGLAGLGAANQFYGTGIQGAQTGLSGVDRQLAGTAQGIQGAQSGLAGVGAQQAGYGLTGQMAGTLGQLGDRQLASQQNIINMQNQLGGQQQAYEQQLINQSIQNYQAQREAPLTAFNQFNALLRGYALPGQTTNQYQAQPNIGSQIAGLGTAGIAGLGLYNASQPRG